MLIYEHCTTAKTILFFRRTFKLVGLRFSLNHLGRWYFLLFLSLFRFDIFIALLPRKHWQMPQNHFFFLLVLITHPPPWRLPVHCTDSEFLLWSLYQGKYLLWPGNLVSQDQWPPRSVMICNDLVSATVFASNAGTMFLITQNLSQVAIQRKKEGLHASASIAIFKPQGY